LAREHFQPLINARARYRAGIVTTCARTVASVRTSTCFRL